jgi:hypothetical protein
MAYEDAQLLMMNDQTLVGQAVGTFLSEKSLYMGSPSTIPGFTTAAPTNDKGRGTPKRLVVEVTTTCVSGGGGTLLAELVMADDEGLTSNLKSLKQTAVIAVAQLVKGYQFRLGYLPPGITKKWAGIRMTIGTAIFTAGKLRAKLVESQHEGAFVGDQG